jgi:hypothetical protein
MAKAQLKTRPTKETVSHFVKSIRDLQVRKDCEVITKMMQEATGERGTMWGASIVGFGTVYLKYASGRELNWPSVGFSPRKQNLTLYLLMGHKNQGKLLKKLGKHSVSKACLYIKKLSDVDLVVLKKLIRESVKETLRKYSSVK